MQQNLKTCSHCGQDIPAESKFCPNCGVKFMTHIPASILNPGLENKISATETEEKKKQADRFEID